MNFEYHRPLSLAHRVNLRLIKNFPLSIILFLLSFFFFLFCIPSLHSQNEPISLESNSNTQIIEQIQNSFQNNLIRYNDPLLEINSFDTNSVKAAKNYYKALLLRDFQEIIALHKTNFESFPNEHYGQMSGIQLVSIDFINHEHDEALVRLNQINNDNIPEALYWRIKINQMLFNYNSVITLGQSFIRQNQSHNLIPFVWLILLETYFQQGDLAGFERNYRTFSSYPSFDEYKPYLIYLNASLVERNNIARARTLYSQLVNEYPQTQYRVQAEDRLFALRTNAERPPTTTQPPVAVTPTQTNPPIPSETTGFRNSVVNRYEDLVLGNYYIQFGVFSTENAARNFVSTLNNDRIQTFHITKPVGGRRLFAVVQGPYQTLSEAQTNQRGYKARNHQSFIFRAE